MQNFLGASPSRPHQGYTIDPLEAHSASQTLAAIQQKKALGPSSSISPTINIVREKISDKIFFTLGSYLGNGSSAWC